MYYKWYHSQWFGLSFSCLNKALTIVTILREEGLSATLYGNVGLIHHTGPLCVTVFTGKILIIQSTSRKALLRRKTRTIGSSGRASTSQITEHSSKRKADWGRWNLDDSQSHAPSWKLYCHLAECMEMSSRSALHRVCSPPILERWLFIPTETTL